MQSKNYKDFCPTYHINKHRSSFFLGDFLVSVGSFFGYDPCLSSGVEILVILGEKWWSHKFIFEFNWPLPSLCVVTSTPSVAGAVERPRRRDLLYRKQCRLALTNIFHHLISRFFFVLFCLHLKQVSPVSVDLRVNRISAISGHMHRLESRRARACLRRRAGCACLPNDAYAQRWR